jgi:hypothetical protein
MLRNGAGILMGNTSGQYWLDLALATTILDPRCESNTMRCFRG